MAHGEGSIFKTKDAKGRVRWRVEVTIGHKPDGTRIRTRRTAKTHAEALQIRRQLVTDRDEYELSFDNPTLNDFALWWIRDVRALRVKQSTAYDYEYRYRKMIAPTFGPVRLDNIDSRAVASWAKDLLGTYAQDSVNGALRVLKMVLGGAVEHGHLRTNPAASIPRVSSQRATSRDNPPWDIHESRRALKASEGHWFGLAVRLALAYGLRRGEIMGLQWGDVDFEADEIHIRRSRREYLAYGNDGVSRLESSESKPKTRSSMRTLRIGETMHEVLWAASMAAQNGPFVSDGDYVIENPKGGSPISSTLFRRGFEDFLKSNQLRKVRFHDLRHTAAQTALASGVRLESVSQNLGHSRIDITKAIYAPSVQSLDNEFAQRQQRYLFTEED